jgi:hypothetical protein
MTALLAEFKEPESLLAAIGRTRQAGHTIVDAFTPYPLAELPRALGLEEQTTNWLGFAGMVLGGLFGWFIQWYPNIAYTLDIGGRPALAPPAFAVLTFEFAVFGGALFLFFGMLLLDRLPKLHHPVFEAPRFYLATRDRYFLLVEVPDESARRFVEGLHPVSIAEVEP